MGTNPVSGKKQPWYRVPPEYQTQIRPDAWRGFSQPRDSYLTTYDLRDDLQEWATTYMPRSKQFPGDAAIYRWCARDWFGPLPPTRKAGRSNGYRIPLEYRYVARLWHVVEDPRVRAAGLDAILESPKSWLVVVANVGSTHYTQADTMDRIGKVLHRAEDSKLPITVTHIGPMTPEKES